MAEKNNFQSIRNKKPLGSGQRLLAIVLVLSTIIVFIFGLWQVKRSIQIPFEQTEDLKEDLSINEVSSQNQDILIEMQNKDTDEDGLNDYEEFYIYKTSPYLADSDSDNINDKEEIESGSDPTCQEGKNCGVLNPNSINNEDQNDIQEEENNIAPEDKNTEIDLFNINDLSKINSSVSDLFEELSVSEIRELLKETGMPSEILDSFTDEQLFKAFQDTLEKMEL